VSALLLVGFSRGEGVEPAGFHKCLYNDLHSAGAYDYSDPNGMPPNCIRTSNHIGCLLFISVFDTNIIQDKNKNKILIRRSALLRFNF
jgi:hypothetical protein